jgi:hypothetical protein
MNTPHHPQPEAAAPHIVVDADCSLFELGQVLVTRFALDKLGNVGVAELLSCHIDGEWGDLCQEDIDANWHALKHGLRLLSRYDTADGDFYVITEWDRSYTTVLYVSEY